MTSVCKIKVQDIWYLVVESAPMLSVMVYYVMPPWYVKISGLAHLILITPFTVVPVGLHLILGCGFQIKC